MREEMYATMMPMRYLPQLLLAAYQRLEELLPASAAAVQPCTAEEVTRLEQQLGIPLPAAYREFLLWMGHGAGTLFRGSDIFYDDLFDDGQADMREAAVELLAENHVATSLPQDAIVFFMHQGYQFAFVRACEGDDPLVYSYNEGLDRDTIIQEQASFSAYLVHYIEWHADILRLNNLPDV